MTRPNTVAIDPFRLDLFPPTTFNRVIKSDNELRSFDKRFDEQLQQDSRTAQRTPNSPRKNPVKLLKMLFSAESHDAQRICHGARPGHNNRAHYQYFDVIENRLGK